MLSIGIFLENKLWESLGDADRIGAIKFVNAFMFDWLWPFSRQINLLNMSMERVPECQKKLKIVG